MSVLRFLTVVITLIVVAASPPANAANLFPAPRIYPSGNFPVDATVQDLNNDGFADIVSANLDDHNVSVFLNTGKGTFGPANTFAVGAGASEVASADLDDDGNADLVVTDANALVYVALGNGDGTFQSSTTIAVPGHPRAIAIGDFDADGILDLAIATLEQVAVLIGNGGGSFGPPVFYSLAGQNGTRLLATDLNKDGQPDLAVAVQHSSHAQDGLATLLGNGDGTFQPAVMWVPNVNATDVAAADFNRDGNVDIALATSRTCMVEVALGNGDGTFQPASSYSTGAGANETTTDTVNAADMNGDGFPDLVVGSEHTAILLGDGSGGFAPALLYGIGQGFARVGYFNGDQVPDIVANGGISATSAASIAVAFGRADGGIKATRVYAVGEHPSLYRLDSFDSADFDGDGHADVVVSGESQFFFLHGIGDGTLAEAIPFADLAAKKLIPADFNGDGKEDVLAVPFSGSVIYTIAGNGDGTFQPAMANTVPNSFYGFNPTVSDFNHDGKTDIAMTDFTTDALFILLGNGDGTFQSPITYDTPAGPGKPPIAADFNIDGNADLMVPHGSGFSVYLGHGDGTFDSPLTVQSKGAAFFAAGDLNRDGKPDLAVGGTVLNVFLGNGDGTFGSAETVYQGVGWLQIGDLDLDHRPDLAMSYFGRLLVFRGKGDGTFQPPAEFSLGSFTSDLVLRDLSGDGTPEVIANNGYNSLTVMLNGARHK